MQVHERILIIPPYHAERGVSYLKASIYSSASVAGSPTSTKRDIILIPRLAQLLYLNAVLDDIQEYLGGHELSIRHGEKRWCRITPFSDILKSLRCHTNCMTTFLVCTQCIHRMCNRSRRQGQYMYQRSIEGAHCQSYSLQLFNQLLVGGASRCDWLTILAVYEHCGAGRLGSSLI